MRAIIVKAVLVLVFLNLTSSVRPASAQDEAVPDPRFGITEAFWVPEEAADLGIGWERILFYWREIQPTGPEDWNTLHVREEWLAEADRQGRIVVGLLKNTAPWASEDGSEAGLPKGLDLPIDDPDNLWANFVRRVADYYSQHNVHHWIIWNEPEIKQGTYGYEFAGSVADYYRLTKVAYQVMKQSDPEAVIHLAGLTWWHDTGYLRRFLEEARSDPDGQDNNNFFDVISLHIYFRTESVPAILKSVMALQTEFEIAKPVWIDETNAPPNQDPLWPVSRPQFQVDLEQQTWFLIQAHALGFASGADRIAVYKLIDIHLPEGGESFGLLRPDFSRRPAFDAYKMLVHYLGGFKSAKREQGAAYSLVSFERPGGVTRVMWARTETDVTVQVPVTGQTGWLVNSKGVKSRIAEKDGYYWITLKGARCEGECIIGGPPLLLVEDREAAQASPTPTVAAVNVPVRTSAAPTLTSTHSPIPSATATVLATEARSTTESIAMEPTSPEGAETRAVPVKSAAAALRDTGEPAAQPVDAGTSAETSQIGLLFLIIAAGLCSGLIVFIRRTARP